MRNVILMLFVICAACMDSNNAGKQQAASTVCGGQLYDGCTADDQCESGLCKLYSNRMVQVCTQPCSATNPCPSQNGVATTCNNMGLCRPEAPNACDVP